jgi:hypothetical protein
MLSEKQQYINPVMYYQFCANYNLRNP